MKKIAVIKIDPAKRLIARIGVERRPETLGRLVGLDAKFEHLMSIEGNPLIIVCQSAERMPDGPKFRIRGKSKVCVGVAFLAGYHAKRAVSAPVDAAWANRMIEWVD